MTAAPIPCLADIADVVRLVVVSDIHATPDGDPPTNVAESKTGAVENALVGARDFLDSEIGDADLVICPGDLVHQGEISPTQWTWNELQGLAQALNAATVAAVGNHDLLRSPRDDQDPAMGLRALTGAHFPLPDKDATNSYWADDFGAFQVGGCRVISMNTCANHGGFDPKAANFGSFRQHALRELTDYLQGQPDGPAINICLLHHHPVEWTHKGDALHGHLLRGDLLIDLLDQRPEHWMVISGHKHHPSLGYLGRSTNGPVWLSAGSIGAEVLTDTGTSVRNQMHVVDIACNAASALGLRFAAEIHSYDWEPGRGWSAANIRSGLPGRCGVGFRRDALELLSDLDAYLRGLNRGNIRWSEIVAWDPRWAYLTPGDRQAMLGQLERNGGGFTGIDDDATLELTFP